MDVVDPLFIADDSSHSYWEYWLLLGHCYVPYYELPLAIGKGFDQGMSFPKGKPVASDLSLVL